MTKTCCYVMNLIIRMYKIWSSLKMFDRVSQKLAKLEIFWWFKNGQKWYVVDCQKKIRMVWFTLLIMNCYDWTIISWSVCVNLRENLRAIPLKSGKGIFFLSKSENHYFSTFQIPKELLKNIDFQVGKSHFFENKNSSPPFEWNSH